MEKIKKAFTWIVFLTSVSLSFGQVLETPKGQVEFIGLKSWNVKELYEKLIAINPDNPICIAGLEKLGFAKAHVKKELQGNKVYSLVTVVEHEYAARIKHRPAPMDTLPPVERWKDILDLFDQQFNEYMLAIQLYFQREKSDALLQDLSADWDVNIFKKIWQALYKKDSEKDRELAIWILLNDGDYNNRIAAASVLSNFHQFDFAWWALLETLRYPDDIVVFIASALLKSLIQEYPRKVDWTPMIPSVRALLDGTNLSAFLTVVKVLTETKISPRFAVPLLENGGSLLIDYLGASRQQERAPVHELLIQLAGKDLGSDPDKWAKWIESVRRDLDTRN